jgi:amino acid adenylation domain-containing protein
MEYLDSASANSIDSSRQIDNLSPAKLALLARRLKAKRVTVEQPHLIPRLREAGALAPLSFAQERIWLIDQLNPGSSGFNLYAAFSNKGKMNLEVYQQVLDEIVRSQEILRTTFPTVDGQPVLALTSFTRHPIPIVDLSQLSEMEQVHVSRQLGSLEKLRPFNLALERPLRAKMLLLSRNECILLLTAHHIATDAWSWDELLAETQTLYSDFSNGMPPSLPELPIQYADYAHWQRQWLQGDVLENQLSYWKEQLSDSPPPLELPTDRQRTWRQPYIGRRLGVVLSRSLTGAIRALTKQEGMTLFMTLSAAFYVLLHRYTGRSDISLGVVISNRNRSEIERLIGLFINTLILRIKFDGHMTFRELITRVRQVTIAAYAHSDLPIEKVLEALQPKRESGLAPMFRVMFGLDNASLATDLGGPSGLDVQRTDGIISSGLESQKNARGLDWIDIDLGLSVQELGKNLHVSIKHNSTLFDASTIRRMLRHFQTLLEGIAANPDYSVGALPLMTAIEEQQLLTEWNDTQAYLEQNQSVFELFMAQESRTPDAIAAAFEEQFVTYQKLYLRANAFAYQLAGYSIGREQVVGIMARRSIDFLTVVLGTLKSHTAYLPLHPFDPPKRLRQILSQSNPDIVLASDEFLTDVQQILETIVSGVKPQVRSIEALLQCGQSTENIRDCHTPRNQCYVIYTSGSTGTPKGAIIEQVGMLNHLQAKISYLQLTASDALAQTASQSFDISVWQFLAPLLVGGKVCVVNDETAHDPLRLLELIEREAITILETVPSLLATAIAEIESKKSPPNLSSLRWLLVTGEAVPPELCYQWMSFYPEIPLLNAYGPTECSDDVTHYRVPQHTPMDMAHMPIGRPICNMRMYVLDGMGMPVPVGVLGELLVGGAGVGRGYLGDPERTSQAFMPYPFSGEPGGRVYKTGDLVRYLPDGNIEFRGRIDHQVKIRGFRIELAEIEMMLNQHPAIRQAVVLAQGDGPVDKRLVAYLIPDQKPIPMPSELYGFLREQLPEYMIPSSFVALDALPLTTNGKIDTTALPAPGEDQLLDPYLFVQPESHLEKKIAAIWSEIMGVDQIGIHDNFFHLGGHSLMAIQVVHRINQAFKVNLSVRNIFEDPTIAGLSLVVEESIIETLEREPME